ncbi:MAG: aspartate/glutamate racemase family protein [Stappiaceae bacterium]
MPANILIINPNSTASMTAEIGEAARSFALSDTTIVAVNPADGPPSIQGAEDGQACLPGLFATFDEAVGCASYDAVIIACFDDTGLEKLKARSDVPVLGIGEAAFHAALILGNTFSTVTTLSVSIPVIEANIDRYGFAERSMCVRASEVPVLEIGSHTEDAIRKEVQCAIEEDNCDSVVLGCAGMATLASAMSADFGVPVIDGVSAAVGFCETLNRLRGV